MAKERFEIAKKDIFSFFNNSKERIFKFKQLSQIFNDNREFWRLTQSMTAREFIKRLIDTKKLTHYKFEFPSNIFNLYLWDTEFSIYKITSRIAPKGYFSHYSALYLNDLTEQIPKTIYINNEQMPKPVNRSSLVQKNIDLAYSRKQRISNNFATFEDNRIYLLNGKNTKNLGVIELNIDDNINVNVTNIERTLIDIVVRPSYSGGIQQVLDSFKIASTKNVSINKLCSILKKLNYVYPYHQAIGFYLERSGAYRKSQIDLLRKFEINYNFYLSYNMKEKEYSKDWKIFYPKGF